MDFLVWDTSPRLTFWFDVTIALMLARGFCSGMGNYCKRTCFIHQARDILSSDSDLPKAIEIVVSAQSQCAIKHAGGY